MIPRISNAAEAAAVASGLRYPPDGSRGIAKMVRASGFGQHFPDYFKNGKDDILGVVQIETAEVLNHLHAVAALDGIDVLFIGTSDLSSELGIAGQMGHAKIIDAYRAVGEACAKHGKILGMGGVYDEENAARYVGMGSRFVLTGNDHSYLLMGADIRSGFFNKLPGVAAAQ